MRLNRANWNDTDHLISASIFSRDTGLVATITQTNVKIVPRDIYGVYNKTWSTYWISTHPFYLVTGRGNCETQ